MESYSRSSIEDLRWVLRNWLLLYLVWCGLLNRYWRWKRRNHSVHSGRIGSNRCHIRDLASHRRLRGSHINGGSLIIHACLGKTTCIRIGSCHKSIKRPSLKVRVHEVSPSSTISSSSEPRSRSLCLSHSSFIHSGAQDWDINNKSCLWLLELRDRSRTGCGTHNMSSTMSIGKTWGLRFTIPWGTRESTEVLDGDWILLINISWNSYFRMSFSWRFFHLLHDQGWVIAHVSTHLIEERSCLEC